MANNTKTWHVHLGLHYMGAGNVGDDLMIAGFIAALQKNIYKIRLTACTPHAIEPQKLRFPEIEWFPYETAERSRLIASADVWLGLGDTPFQSDCGNWMIKHLQEELIMCRQYKLPMYFLDCGFNNENALKNKIIQEVINYTSHIWTRDNLTYRQLVKLAGINKVTAGADLAHVWLEQWQPEKKEKKSIGWVMNFENKNQFNPVILSQAVTKLEDKHHYWLVQEVRKLNGSEKNLLDRLRKKVAENLRICIPEYASAGRMEELLSAWIIPEIIVSSRYHATLIGAWAGCKILPVVRNDKLRGVVEDLDCVYIDSITDDKNIIHQLKQCDKIARNKLKTLSKVAKKSIDDFIDLIQKRDIYLKSGNSKSTVPAKIAWIRTDSIGDNVLASSMLPHIRSRYPRSEIVVVCQDHIAELYNHSPCIDRIVSFNKAKIIADENYRNNTLQSLRAINADLVLNTVYSRDVVADIVSFACGSKERVAFEGDLNNISKNQLRKNNRFYTTILDDSENYTEIEHHHSYLKKQAVDVDMLDPKIWSSEKERNHASDFFSSNNLEKSKVIALFPGAQFQHKEYNQYNRVLRDFSDHVLIVFGSNEDSDAAEIICADFSGISFNLAGKTSILEMAELVKLCNFSLGSDSAGAHIACAVGIPNIVIMGGGHFARFLPYSPLTSVVALPLQCYRCNWMCEYDINFCIKSIHPFVIKKAIQATLENKNDRPRIFLQSKRSWKSTDNIPKWEWNDNFINARDVDVITVVIDDKGNIQNKSTAHYQEINNPPRKIIGSIYKNRLMIIAGMATMPTRTETFYKALRSILPQVDRLYLFFDQFEKLPEIRHSKIVTLRSQDHGNFHSSGKFMGLLMTPPGSYYLSVDDDILYPPGYVKKMIWHLHQYQNNVVAGVHGFTFNNKFQSYIKDRNIVNRSARLPNPYQVDVLGTGTVMFNTSLLTFDMRNWQFPNMVDLQFAHECAIRKIPALLVPRERFWIKELGALQSDSIYADILRDDSKQTEFSNKLLQLQTENTDKMVKNPDVPRLPLELLEWDLRVQRDNTCMDKILRSILTKTSNCIDIGAHEGLFLKRFMELSPEGHHFAFEALPGFASYLSANFPKVNVFNCALGNHSGRVTFNHVLNLPGWSGLKTQAYPVESKIKTIKVDMKRLDELMPSDIQIDFIKVDVEGAEFEVFEGAKDTIKKYKPSILFEHAKIHNLEYGTTPEMVYDLLVTECGLDIYCLDGRGPLTRVELAQIYHASYDSNYDRYAQTNFLAKPI